jgi:2,5-diketo-D-gluconate reductase A
VTVMKTRTLNDGTVLPPVGFGTYPHRGEDSAVMVQTALELGYRLLDTALRYGNEHAVGEGIRRSGIDRDEVIVTSKLPGRYHGRRGARTAVAESLRNLGLDRIDLYLIHWPLPRLGLFVETWEELVRLRDEGMLGSVGVSNFTAGHLQAVIDATGVVPAVNQVELHPFFPQPEARSVHERLGIVTEAWSPLGRGTGLLEEPLLAAVAAAHGVTPGQVVLRWHVQLGVVPVPMSSSPERQRANLDLAGFELSGEEMAAISALGRGRPIWGQDPEEFEEF